MYLNDYTHKITSDDLDFLKDNFIYFDTFKNYYFTCDGPETRVEFFVILYINIPGIRLRKLIEDSELKSLNMNILLTYMIENLDLIEVLDNISLYRLYEQKTFIENDEQSYAKKYHQENQKCMVKLIQKLPNILIENQLQSNCILSFLFQENFIYCPWRSLYFVKILVKANLDLNILPLSVLGRTFINEKKLENWKRIISCTKLVYFLIENNYNFKHLNINTNLNLYLKKMLLNYQIKESCFRGDNLLGIIKLNESLEQEGLTNIFL